MIIVSGTLRVLPEHIEALRPHVATLIDATRREPGCLFYAWGEDLLEPGVIRMIEHWQDWTAFEAHDSSPHALAFKAALAPLGLLGREMWAHDAANERAI